MEYKPDFPEPPYKRFKGRVEAMETKNVVWIVDNQGRQYCFDGDRFYRANELKRYNSGRPQKRKGGEGNAD